MIVPYTCNCTCKTAVEGIHVGPVEQKNVSVKVRLFSYPSVSKCVLGAQKNRLIETILLSTHNICFG